MSIRRRVELLLDRAAARRVERDTQRSLDKGTDPRKPEKNLGRVGGAFKKLKAAGLALGAVLAVAFALKKIAAFGKAVFDLGASVGAVRSQFLTVFGAATEQVDTFVDSFRRMAGLTKREAEEIAAGAGSMAQGFGASKDASADFAQEVIELSADLASFNNIPTAEAAKLVQSALIGNTEAARSLKINFTALDVQTRALEQTGKTSAKELTQLEKAIAGVSVITERAGPQIGDLARTQDDADNQAKQLAGSFKQLKEALSAALVGGLRGSTVFGDLRDVFENMTKWVERNAAEISKWSGVAIKVLRAFAVTAINSFRIAFNNVQTFVEGVKVGLLGMVRFAASAMNRMAEGLNRGIELLNRVLPDALEIDFRIGGFDIRELDRLIAEGKTNIVGNFETIRESLGKVTGAWVDVFKAATAAAVAQREASAPEIVRPAGFEPIDITLNEDAIRASIARANELLAERLAVFEAAQAVLQERATATAVGMTSAFQTFFEASGAGFADAESVWAAAADAARGAGASIVEGLVAGRVETEIALGTAALAAGIWPPNPAAFLAAAKHFAAAALFKSIPGIVRGGGGGAGGGGGGAVSRGAVGSAAPGAPAPLGPEINIFLDQLSPADPAFQRVVLGGLQNAQERFGDNVQLNVHPRSGR